MSRRPSKSFGAQQAKLQHLLASPGGLSGEIVDLRNDTDEGFENSEGRVGFPELDWLTAAAAAAGGTTVLNGRVLLQGQTFDHIQVVDTTAILDLYALKPGDSEISVQIVVGVGALSIAYSPSTKDLVITLAAGGSTPAAIATAINLGGAQSKGHIRAVSSGSGSFVAALAQTPFTDGVGNYAGNKVEVGGVEALPLHATGVAPAATWANTVISVTVPALLAAGNIAAVRVQSNGVQSDAISCVLA